MAPISSTEILVMGGTFGRGHPSNTITFDTKTRTISKVTNYDIEQFRFDGRTGMSNLLRPGVVAAFVKTAKIFELVQYRHGTIHSLFKFVK